MSSPDLSRRRFLELASRGATAGALGLPLLLEACSPSTPAAAPTSAAAPKPTSPPAAPTSAPAPTSAGAAPAATTAAAPTSAAAPGATVTTVEGVKLPTYIPFNGPPPDLPGNAQ